MAVSIQPTANPLVEFLVRYGPDPVAFVRDVLGGDPDENQVAILSAIARGDRQIAVRSGHGVGKTWTLAWAIVWHAVTKFPQKTVCTAATAPQLFDALAAETKAWFKKLPPALLDMFEIKVESIHHREAPEESFISFRTSRPETPEALAGVHSEHVLLICDEASGIADTIFEAASGSMSGHSAVTVMAGNPIRTSGLFFDAFRKAGVMEQWTRFHISCIGHPRINPAFIEEQKIRYGGEDDPRFRVRVLGEFPKADSDTIIPFELAESAITRDVRPNPMAAIIWGVDCARFGDDKSALAKRKGNVLVEPAREWGGLDVMELSGHIKREWDDCDPKQRPAEINIDSIGIGAGVYDRLRELGLPARGINVSEVASRNPDQYANLRTELWFEGRAWLTAMDCALGGVRPDGTRWGDDGLLGELTQQRYRYRSNGKWEALPKEEMKRLGFKSPNRADAFLLTLASDHVTLAHGSRGATTWRTPLTRIIKGLV